MVSRLNFVVISLCIVVGLSASATYTSEDKSKPLHPIPLPPLDVISTGNIAIHPDETTSFTVNGSARQCTVHCRGNQQKTQLTLTGSTAEQQLAVETDATTWVRNPSTLCRISSNNEAPDILCTSSSSLLDTLFPELSGLKQNDTLLSEFSYLLQDGVFQSVICTSAGECA
ncbi:hypothetical protein, partial [Sansalvadorimonas verongulae]|uniref:hypothetical protein n=1 Tax=Sansalvadorimonas verongulae TaxID=2172824 RepID=UPI001E61FDFE